ncbi:hypothetical protein IEU95_01755 [Hoyosella rhizosphaerae]|uniref:Uncharacterized protein n=1 Tax=Hoyosella rhizosphaerae TaxID=1755582 RepID=A0A916XFJ9_9ACTN|nr:hypothetical protein [Hoyosella rhizosphaerae]MBN4925540.1 hypothetical protein [Hoyosella rhizosphaerae]GGC69856.1 hypothetical protein GCM10011410_23350 [Hoyosella rhizosphaerae]
MGELWMARREDSLPIPVSVDEPLAQQMRLDVDAHLAAKDAETSTPG